MSSTPAVREVVVQEISTLLEEGGRPVPALDDDDVLMQAGLDSLSFAILITRLEDRFGYDPFTEMEVPVYPRTLQELTSVYAEHRAADHV